MESRKQNSQPKSAEGPQSGFTELPMMLEQSDEHGEELAIKRQIWKKLCERLNQLEREEISFREAQRGKNGT